MRTKIDINEKNARIAIDAESAISAKNSKYAKKLQ